LCSVAFGGFSSEQQEFLVLFENYVVLTYSEKLSDYTEDGGRP
jgi:ABC-type transporter MlaC component